MANKRDDAVFWGVVGIIVLVEALTWLGTEVGIWTLDFPFWATMAVWIGFAIVVSSIRKLLNPKEGITKSEPWC